MLDAELEKENDDSFFFAQTKVAGEFSFYTPTNTAASASLFANLSESNLKSPKFFPFALMTMTRRMMMSVLHIHPSLPLLKKERMLGRNEAGEHKQSIKTNAECRQSRAES